MQSDTRACGAGRPPRGGRGLKLGEVVTAVMTYVSPPSRGAWIEMIGCNLLTYCGYVAPLAGGVD